MQSPYPPLPPYAPRPGSDPGESDRELLAQAAQGPASVPGARASALLLARHWRATYEYAVICLATVEHPASMAATAAFHRVLDKTSGGALRPQLLVAVRETVKEWVADDRISAALPELRKPTGGRGLRAARAETSERRRLAERAFRKLPGASQCLLWHVEVEAEPITVPAGLLGVDPGTALTALDQAREQFRVGCVRAHHDLAPSKECRFYNRLLDVPLRRGGALLPDVRQHLVHCRYCRFAAEQLSYFEGGLGALLAETVLGWGALRYLESRPGRSAERVAPGRPAPAAVIGRHRPVMPRRHTKAAVVGVGLTSLALLATVLVAKGWSDDNGVPDPHATWGAPSGNTTLPQRSAEGASADGSSPSAASVGQPVEVGRGRLRNPADDLCLDIKGGRALPGVAAVLADCSTAASQQWSYQDDGLLRSGADPTLCLDAETGSGGGSVVVAGCLVHAGEVRYDLTVRGELLLRGGKGLLVAAGQGKKAGDVVVAGRDGSARQRWVLEAGVGGDGSAAAGNSGGAETENGGPGANGRPEGDSAAGGAEGSPGIEGQPQPSQSGLPGDGQSEGQPYETRVAQVGDESGSGGAVDPAPAQAPAVLSDTTDGLRKLPAELLDTVAAITTPLTTGLGSALRLH
ncbi:ricin-type beta-trefoil lectin domain protein [Streptomyces sp. NPDC002499]